MTLQKIPKLLEANSVEKSSLQPLEVSCSGQVFRSLIYNSVDEYKNNLRESIALIELTECDRLLVFRTANVHLVEALLSSLFLAVPFIEVDLVTQKVFLPYLKSERVRPLLISDGPITGESLKAVFSECTPDNRYSLALIPYSNARGHGYENVHRAVRRYFSGKLIGIGSNGRLQSIQRHPRIRKVCTMPLRAASFAILITFLAMMAIWFKTIMPATRQLIKSLNLR